MLRSRFSLGLGVVMLLLGAFVGLRLAIGEPPLTRSVLLDLAFVAFFVLRGGMNIRAGRNSRVTLSE